MHVLYLHLAWLNYGLDVLNITVNSNMTLTVLNLYQMTDPKVQQDFLGQYDYDKVKGKIKVAP